MNDQPVLSVTFFRTDAGRLPVQQWLKSLNKADRKVKGIIYGLTFLCYEKAIQPVAEHRNTRRKLQVSVITLIKDTLMETWTSQALLTSLDDCRCRGDTCLATY